MGGGELDPRQYRRQHHRPRREPWTVSPSGSGRGAVFLCLLLAAILSEPCESISMECGPGTFSSRVPCCFRCHPPASRLSLLGAGRGAVAAAAAASAEQGSMNAELVVSSDVNNEGSSGSTGRGSSGSSARTETLVFRCDFEHVTSSSSLSASRVGTFVSADRRLELADFLQQKSVRDMLLSVGGKRSAQEHPLTPELRRLWEEQVCKDDADDFYGESCFLPTIEESSSSSAGDHPVGIVSTETSIRFPGLTVTSIVYIGTKLLWDHLPPPDASSRGMAVTTTMMPAHEFVLLGEHQRVEGPPPLVWLYRKLTGIPDNDDDGGGDTHAQGLDGSSAVGTIRPSKARSWSRVAVVETLQGGLALSFATALEIRVDFPSLLVKILPTSKEKMEEQGSAAVLKAVSKDIVDAVTLTWDAFLASSS